ncbi:MAG TPA: hypothetical protein DCE18_07045 [Syntrophobacteraceae bacterium]|nr:hypothetical protein [Syntrophobacteraceae bacterium]
MNKTYGILWLLLALLISATSLEARMEVVDPRSDGREPTSYAWWVALEFKPMDTAIEGIPVQQIRPDWIRASILTKESIPPKAFQEDGGRDSMADARVAFSRDGDFNGDGIPDKAVVGTYEDRKGGLGQFLLILTRGTGEAWKVLVVNVAAGKPGFSALRAKGKRLQWWFCMQCDDFVEVLWDAKKKTFRLKSGMP